MPARARRSVGRSQDRKDEELERAHMETAERMVDALGNMKGAAMKIGQLASFIDTDFLPPEYRELYQEKLGKLRDHAPAMPWKDVRSVLEEELEDPVEELFEDFERGGGRRRLDRPGPPRHAARRQTRGGEDPVPGDRPARSRPTCRTRA